MSNFFLRFVLYLLTFVVFVGGIGFYGFTWAYKNFYATVYNNAVSTLQGVKIPEYNPNKPTVAVLMGDSSTTTEVQNPNVDPYNLDLRFSTYILNNAFQWNKKNVGLLLYNGMEEMALSSIFDTYADTGTTKVFTITSSKQEQTIVTEHNLNLFARYEMSGVPKLDKTIVPGAQAKSLAAEDVKLWNEKGSTKELLFMHSDSPDRFVFEAPLEDLAKQEDLLTGGNVSTRSFIY